jgi:hypothetical protein
VPGTAVRRAALVGDGRVARDEFGAEVAGLESLCWSQCAAASNSLALFTRQTHHEPGAAEDCLAECAGAGSNQRAAGEEGGGP